ncbi:MAG: beta-ketoacyl-[acyl-carrier-protein] synthase family protein, partial [Proteobacteria bacterium]
LGRADSLRFDTVTLLAIGACHEALAHAGLETIPRDGRSNSFEIAGADPRRVGVYVGTGIGGINTTLKTHLFHAMSRVRGELSDVSNEPEADTKTADAIAELVGRIEVERRFNPLAVTMLMSNAVSAAPGVRFGVKGPCRTTTLACASGTAAIGDAYKAVANGELDVALAGAAEYLYDEYGSIFRSYDITGAMTHGIDDPAMANRPFDEDRRGFLFSEGGAAILVLERADSARARGARPLAEIAGFGESFDGHNLIAIDSAGTQVDRMIRSTLERSGMTPDDIGYINAHGTGTELNDEVELNVLSQIFGDDVLVNSTKGLIGHTIGASGAIEAAVTALSIRDGVVHPCNNLDSPIRPMNFPLNARRAAIDAALTQSFAFGGHNACLLIRRPA